MTPQRPDHVFLYFVFHCFYFLFFFILDVPVLWPLGILVVVVILYISKMCYQSHSCATWSAWEGNALDVPVVKTLGALIVTVMMSGITMIVVMMMMLIPIVWPLLFLLLWWVWANEKIFQLDVVELIDVEFVFKPRSNLEKKGDFVQFLNCCV